MFRDAVRLLWLSLANRVLRLAQVRNRPRKRGNSSLPRPGLPWRLGANAPVSRRSLIMSFTNFGETRKCRAALRCEQPSSTKATTRSLNSIGCGSTHQYPQICYKIEGITIQDQRESRISSKTTCSKHLIFHETGFSDRIQKSSSIARIALKKLAFPRSKSYHLRACC